MKSTIARRAVLLAQCICAPALPAFSLSAAQIVAKVEEVESAPHAISRVKQRIVTPSGQTREFELRLFSLDTTDKQLQVYEKPARVQGEKILMLNGGDDIWAYSPKTKRVRHLATHMKKAKVMGSDFSYEDYAAGDYLQRFSVTLCGRESIDNQNCYKLEMLPTPQGPSYAKQLVWVGTDDFVPRRVEYYDSEGLLKTLTLSDIRLVDGRPTPWKLVMKNVRDGGETHMQTLEIDYTHKPDPTLFTQQGLKK